MEINRTEWRFLVFLEVLHMQASPTTSPVFPGMGGGQEDLRKAQRNWDLCGDTEPWQLVLMPFQCLLSGGAHDVKCSSSLVCSLASTPVQLFGFTHSLSEVLYMADSQTIHTQRMCCTKFLSAPRDTMEEDKCELSV